jgi:hypothetical protein
VPELIQQVLLPEIPSITRLPKNLPEHPARPDQNKAGFPALIFNFNGLQHRAAGMGGARGDGGKSWMEGEALSFWCVQVQGFISSHEFSYLERPRISGPGS